MFILGHILCSKDLCLGWILIVLWSFFPCLFWSFGNVLRFKTSIRQGSSCSDSSTDRRGTCGRKIRLKCAGCNQCGGWVTRRGKWCSFHDEVRGDAVVVRRWRPSWLRVLKRCTASPTRWSQVKIKTSYLCCQYLGFCSPLSWASWSSISNIADGFRNINSAKKSGLPRLGGSFQDLLAAASECCLRFINTLISDTLKKQQHRISLDYKFFCC